MTIQPDGSFSTQPVHTFDFVNSNCVPNGCQDPSDTDQNTLANAFSAEFAPAEVIPDGLGGVLAAWSGGGADLGAGAARVRHFDGSGATVDYTVPLFSSQWSPPIATPKALILGENNIAFASDGLSAASVDATNGTGHWTFQPPGGTGIFARTGVALLASTAPGGVAAYTTDPSSSNVNALVTFDSLGVPTSFPITGALNSLSIFDNSSLLATSSSGEGQLASAVDLQLSEGIWFTPGGQDKQRAPVPPVITITQSQPLWWFNGQNPDGFTDGATKITLTANGETKGTFRWDFTKGATKASFPQGQTSATLIDSNTVGVVSKDVSTQGNDVTVTLTYTSPGGQVSKKTYSFSVDAPFKLITPQGQNTATVGASACKPFATGTAGYRTQVPYQIISKLGNVVKNIPVNEVFDETTVVNFQDNDWAVPTEGAITTPNGSFVDAICRVDGDPHPLPPQTPLTNNKVDQIPQFWFVGGLQNGFGVVVQTNNLVRFVDHGAHSTIVSPVP
jgi:hypothetical protein